MIRAGRPVGRIAAVALFGVPVLSANPAAAVAYPNCAVGSYTTPGGTSYCTLAAGLSITVTVKSGNGGRGGPAGLLEGARDECP